MTLRSRLVGAMPLAVLAACATMSAGADLDPKADFSDYRTFAWDPAHVHPTGDPRLDGDPLFDTRVRSLVGGGLSARGLREMVSDSSDLLIHYHASVRQRVEVYTVDRRYGYDYDGEEDQVYEWEEGVLVLCVVEPQTSQVIWRGWVQADVDHVMHDPEKIEERLEEAVVKLLELFPLLSGQD